MKTPNEIGIEEMEISCRLTSSLKRIGIKSVGELAGWREYDLLQQFGVGKTQVKEIREQLARFDMRLRDDGSIGTKATPEYLHTQIRKKKDTIKKLEKQIARFERKLLFLANVPRH